MKKQKDADELKYEEEKKEARESGKDFRFRRRELTSALTERATWGDRGKTMREAFAILGKKDRGKANLSAKEVETLRRALRNYEEVSEHFTRAAIHAEGLLADTDEAGKLYRAGNRSGAAHTLAWTTGKRGPTEDHNSIVATYLLHIGMGYSTSEAVQHIVTLFNLTSRNAAIQILKRNKKKQPCLPLPSTWQDNY
jgi:hypothetical protein